MAEKDAENGDAAFERYLKENAEKSADRSLFIIIYSLKEKTRFISNFYSTTLEAYMKLDANDSLKEDLKKTLVKLSRYSMKVLSQFDYVLLDDIDDEDEKI